MSEETSSAKGRRSYLSATLAGGLVLLYVLGMSLTFALEARAGVREFALPEQVALAAAFGWFVLLGALLTWRQPRNPMGWIFVAIVLLTALGPPGPAYVDLVLRDGGEPTAGLAMLAWPNTWYWYALLGLMFVFVPLLFPDGRLPSRRWRPLAWIAGIAVAGFCVLGAVGESIVTQGARHVIANPIGIAGLAHPEESWLGGVLGVGIVIGILGAFASLVVRFRRAHGRERLQIKWLLLASGLVVLAVLTEPLQGSDLAIVSAASYLVAFNALPLAIAVAILRYRLYAIDRIVSRTLSYATVIVVLVATYATGVLVLGQLLAPLGAGNDLAVAVSTLVAAAIFRPLLSRVRAGVDRRFNRARYDAERTVQRFASRLRDEVDLDALTDDLRQTVRDAVQPRGVSMWLAAEETQR